MGPYWHWYDTAVISGSVASPRIDKPASYLTSRNDFNVYNFLKNSDGIRMKAIPEWRSAYEVSRYVGILESFSSGTKVPMAQRPVTDDKKQSYPFRRTPDGRRPIQGLNHTRMPLWDKSR